LRSSHCSKHSASRRRAGRCPESFALTDAVWLPARIARWMEWIVAVSYYCASFCVTVSVYVAPWLRAVCIFCVFYSVEYVVAAWRCRWALLVCFWGGRGDVVVVGHSDTLWVVGSSWWFYAFSTAAVGCGDALPQGPLSLGSSRDRGGEGTGGICRRVGGRPPQAFLPEGPAEVGASQLPGRLPFASSRRRIKAASS